MKIRFHVAMFLCAGIVCVGIVVGCGQRRQIPSPSDEGQAADSTDQQEQVDPHDVPLTEEQKQQMREETAKFADAVAKVRQLRDAVEQETKNGLPDGPFEAHQALDKVDLLVQRLPEIARDSGVPKQSWEAVNTAANELRELFEQVHQNIDNKADPDFASVQEQIDAGIGELQTISDSLSAGE